MSFTALQPWRGVRAHVHRADDARPHPTQIRTDRLLVHRRGHLLGGARADRRGHSRPAETSAIADDGRLRGGLDDPNYLAAGHRAVDRDGGGPRPGRAQRPRPDRARRRWCVILVLGLGATESRGGLMAAIVATAAAVVVAKRGRSLVIAFVAIMVGLVAIWFASHARCVEAGHPHGGQGERPQQPLDGGRPDLEGPPGRRRRARELPRVRAALRERPGRAHVRELHRGAPSRGAQRLPPDLVEVGAGGPRPVPGDHRQLARRRAARRAEVRERGGTSSRRRSPRSVFVAAARGARRLLLHLERERLPDLGAAGVRADAAAAGAARGGPGGGAGAGSAVPRRDRRSLTRRAPALQA